MTNQHPIQPSPELIEQWLVKGSHQDYCSSTDYAIAQSAQWGADHELEACCQWLDEGGYTKVSGGALRTIRRPEAPSLKELAVKAIDDIERRTISFPYMEKAIDTIRRALEALPND